MDRPPFLRIFIPLVLTAFAAVPSYAQPPAGQPPSAIAADRQGLVAYVDAGSCVWNIDLQDRMQRYQESRVGFMAVDEEGNFKRRGLPRSIQDVVKSIGVRPALILSKEFPVAIGSDGASVFLGSAATVECRGLPRGPKVLSISPMRRS